MAVVDIDPFGGAEWDEASREHDRTESRPDENIPLTPVGGGSTWEPEREQKTSFRGESHASVLYKEYLVGEIFELIGNKTHQRLEPNLSLFEVNENGRLYYKGKPLMNRNGELKTIGVIADTLGIKGLREMGFDISKTNLKPQHVLDLLEKRIDLPSALDITKADDIELQEITEETTKSMEDLISQMKHDQSQTDESFEYPSRKLLGLDKQLRSIRGSLKVEVAKKVQLEESIKKERRKLEEFREYPGVYDVTEETTKSMEDLISQMRHYQSQTDESFEYPSRELLGLDEQLRSIRGSLKVEVAKKVQLEESIKKERQEFTMMQ